MTSVGYGGNSASRPCGANFLPYICVPIMHRGLMGKARPATACQNLRAFDGHRIAKGSPLAAGSMGVAHATRICAIVHNSGQARWRPLFGSSIYPC
jgi:hypothetical protein